MTPRPGLLLVNLGTPDAPRTPEVRRYLREFLSDPRVLDMHPWARAALLNTVILPFRPAKAAKAYAKIWTDRGSPLKVHGEDLVEKLQAKLGAGTDVRLAMRYGEPSIGAALDAYEAAGVAQVVAFPLFPHYASSSWGSAVEKLYQEAGSRINTPALTVVPPYYDHPAYIRATAAVARPVLDAFTADKVLISFHSLPKRHMRNGDASGKHCLAATTCCDTVTTINQHCYRAQCYATARALAAALELEEERWEVSFQSRLTREPWIEPHTDVRLLALPGEGVKKLAVIVPSFTADCLETLEEIAIRGKDAFVSAGGEDLRLIPCVNSDDAWVDSILEILKGNGALAPATS